MKFFIGLILSAFVLQALALPAFEDPKAPEHMPEDSNLPEFEPRNEIVDAFREEINRQFVRFTTFYDRTNAAMRTYRLAHVDLVARVYNGLMTVFGDSIEAVRQAAYELDDMITTRTEELGGVTPCLADIIAARDANSAAVGAEIQVCTIYANTTLTGLLLNTFYPTFAAIQATTSTIPVSVIDVLSRGNVLEDEQAIIQYLVDRYAVLELQWLGSVSQLLRWETNRFENEGLFLSDQTLICMANATWQFLLNNSRFEGEVLECT